MTTALDLDLKKLKARAFDRAEWAERVLRNYHAANLNPERCGCSTTASALQLDVCPNNALAV